MVAPGLDHLAHCAVGVAADAAACSGDRLGSLVRVVREDEIGTAAVQIEPVAEDAETHGDAFDVPPGPTIAPR